MVNALYHAAKRRAQSKRALWVLAIDEFPQFVTTDVARGLDELRKFGVRLILAHQRLAQLPDDLRSAVLTNAKLRAVFGGLSREDAEVLARELFTGEVRGDLVKHITYQTKFRPYLRQVEITAEATGGSSGSGNSDGWSDVSSYGETTDETLRHALSTTHSSGGSGGYSSTDTESWSKSVADAYVTEHEEFIEETGRQFWSIDEEWEKLVARVFNLDRREVLVKVFNQPVRDIITPDVKQYPARPTKPPRRPKPMENGSSESGTEQPPTIDGDPNNFWEPRQ